jgi:hypothetical protein
VEWKQGPHTSFWWGICGWNWKLRFHPFTPSPLTLHLPQPLLPKLQAHDLAWFLSEKSWSHLVESLLFKSTNWQNSLPSTSSSGPPSPWCPSGADLSAISLLWLAMGQYFQNEGRITPKPPLALVPSVCSPGRHTPPELVYTCLLHSHPCLSSPHPAGLCPYPVPLAKATPTLSAAQSSGQFLVTLSLLAAPELTTPHRNWLPSLDSLSLLCSCHPLLPTCNCWGSCSSPFPLTLCLSTLGIH